MNETNPSSVIQSILSAKAKAQLCQEDEERFNGQACETPLVGCLSIISKLISAGMGLIKQSDYILKCTDDGKYDQSAIDDFLSQAYRDKEMGAEPDTSQAAITKAIDKKRDGKRQDGYGLRKAGIGKLVDAYYIVEAMKTKDLAIELATIRSESKRLQENVYKAMREFTKQIVNLCR